MSYRTKPIRQMFHLKDFLRGFTPDGKESWTATTLVGYEPIVHGMMLLESDDLLVELTEDRIASVTRLSEIAITVSKVGVKYDNLHWIGRIVRSYKLGLFMGEASVEMDVWTDATVEPFASVFAVGVACMNIKKK